MSKSVIFLCALPLISVIFYTLSRPALFEAGLILTASVLVTSGIIYLGVYKDSLFPLVEQPQTPGNGKLEEFPFEFLESDIASFQQCIFLLTRLRKQLLSSTSKDIRIRRVFESGIHEKFTQVFDACESANDERLYRAVAFLEAVFCEAPEDLPFIKSDSFPAFLRNLVNIQRKWQYDHNTIIEQSLMRLQFRMNRTLTAIAAKWPHHRRLLGDFKALTLVFDGSLRRHILSDENVILWALRFLIVMTAENHAVNKAEVYRIATIPTLIDLIATYKQQNRNIVFYSVVLLGQLLESGCVDSRYSIAQARQECAMSNILQSLTVAEQSFRGDVQFAGQVKEVSQLIFTNFS